MLDKLIQDLKTDCDEIKTYLGKTQIEDAEKTLASAEKKLRELIEYSDYSIFIPNYKELFSECIDMFAEVFMKISFASAYNLTDAYAQAISTNNADEAAIILQQLDTKMTFMHQSYLNAQRDGRSQTAAFIDFEKDFSYLRKNLEESKKNAVMQQVCSNFERALNFKETKQLFFNYSGSHHLASGIQELNPQNDPMVLK